MNQTVETYLRHYVNRNQNNWVQLLSTAQFVYNNTQNETTEETPFEQIMNITWRYDKNCKHTDHKARKQY
jgi:hypothetical protein